MTQAQKNLQMQIENASMLQAGDGAACLEDPELGGLLRELDHLARRTDALMLSTGVVAACSRCAAATGSCCFAEMGESYGAIQLLANRLLGAEIPREGDGSASCFFVGAKGCTLKARHSFCLNYFCPELIDSLGEQTVFDIQRQVGQQLSVGWDLERALTRFIASRSTPKHL
jgi:hypothetical protein